MPLHASRDIFSIPLPCPHLINWFAGETSPLPP